MIFGPWEPQNPMAPRPFPIEIAILAAYGISVANFGGFLMSRILNSWMVDNDG